MHIVQGVMNSKTNESFLYAGCEAHCMLRGMGTGHTHTHRPLSPKPPTFIRPLPMICHCIVHTVLQFGIVMHLMLQYAMVPRIRFADCDGYSFEKLLSCALCSYCCFADIVSQNMTTKGSPANFKLAGARHSWVILF